MHQIRVFVAIHDPDLENRVSATAQAADYLVAPVHQDIVTNDTRSYEPVFVVEETFPSILSLIEFHNSCLFNFLPTIVIVNESLSLPFTARFPYKYFTVKKSIVLDLMINIIKMLDELRRTKHQEYLLRHQPALMTPFTVTKSGFRSALGEALGVMCDFLFAAKGSFMLLNAAGNLVVEAATRQELVGIEVPFDPASPAWHVIKSGEPLFCEDITKDPRFSKKAASYAKDYFLIVPIRIQKNVVGVFNLTDKTVSLLFDRGDLIRARGLLRLIEPVLAAHYGVLAVH